MDAPPLPPDEVKVADVTPVVYEELRRLARRERYRLSGGHTLSTTALIHEAYLRLSRAPRFASRGDFLRVAAVAMRRILVDRVRAQLAQKRGGGTKRVDLDDVADFLVGDAEQVLAVHEALQRLGALNPRLADLVECRFFAGYSEPETAGGPGHLRADGPARLDPGPRLAAEGALLRPGGPDPGSPRWPRSRASVVDRAHQDSCLQAVSLSTPGAVEALKRSSSSESPTP